MAEIVFKIEDEELDQVIDLVDEVAGLETLYLDIRPEIIGVKSENESKLDFLQRVFSVVLSSYIKGLSRTKASTEYQKLIKAIPEPTAAISVDLVKTIELKP